MRDKRNPKIIIITIKINQNKKIEKELVLQIHKLLKDGLKLREHLHF